MRRVQKNLLLVNSDISGGVVDFSQHINKRNYLKQRGYKSELVSTNTEERYQL